MSFQFKQSTGEFFQDGTLLAMAYSGHGDGVNNPTVQNIRMVGPIPRGRYTIQPAYVHEHLGPLAMPLVPYSSNEMFMRDGFFIHGDNSKGDRSASEGCIILPHDARVVVARAALTGGNNVLEVIE